MAEFLSCGSRSLAIPQKVGSTDRKKELGIVFRYLTYFILAVFAAWNLSPNVQANPGRDAVSILQENCVGCHGGFEVHNVQFWGNFTM